MYTSFEFENIMTMPLEAAPYFRLCRENCQRVEGGTNPEQKFKRKELLPLWPRAKKMEPIPLLRLKDYV